LDKQFLIGNGLLISPVLQAGATSVSAYFPAGAWYDWYTHAQETDGKAQWKTVSAPIDKIPVHIRGGVIIPIQQPSLTTTDTRKNPFGLIVALSNSSGSAQGTLYYDDGESLSVGQDATLINFSASSQGRTSGSLKGTPIDSWSGIQALPLDVISVLGIAASPSSVKLNGFDVKFQFQNQELTLSNLGIPLNHQFNLVWQ